MQLSDRITGAFLVALGAVAAYAGSRLPPVLGQLIGPNVFPMAIGFGLCLCGVLIAQWASSVGSVNRQSPAVPISCMEGRRTRCCGQRRCGAAAAACSHRCRKCRGGYERSDAMPPPAVLGGHGLRPGRGAGGAGRTGGGHLPDAVLGYVRCVLQVDQQSGALPGPAVALS